jgi:hypothetical protein
MISSFLMPLWKLLLVSATCEFGRAFHNWIISENAVLLHCCRRLLIGGANLMTLYSHWALRHYCAVEVGMSEETFWDVALPVEI